MGRKKPGRNQRKRDVSRVIIPSVSFFTVFFFSLLLPSFFTELESDLHDALFRLRYSIAGSEPVSPYLVHIVINDESLSLMNAAGPDRNLYADLIDIAWESGARCIACDAFFETDSPAGKRERIVESVRRAGNVYLPIVLNTSKTGGIRTPFPDLLRASRGTGHINCLPDPDGINRRFPLYVANGNLPAFALPFRIVRDYLSVGDDEIDVVEGRWIKLRNAEFAGNSRKDISIPIDDRGAVVLNYVSPRNDSFYTISATDLLSAAAGNASRRSNLRDVLEDSIVFISETSVRNKDVGPGVYDGLIPYSEILLTVTNMILTNRFVSTLPRHVTFLILVGIIVLFVFPSKNRNPRRFLLAETGIMTFYIVASVTVFIAFRALLPLVVPLCGFVLHQTIRGMYLSSRTIRTGNENGSYAYVSAKSETNTGGKIKTTSMAETNRDFHESNEGFQNGKSVTAQEPIPTNVFPLDRDSLLQSEAFGNLITRDPAMIRIFHDVEAYRNTEAPILIIGETGVGKELIAHAIHKVSGRTGKYITVNIAGIDDSLFNDTLFGHKRGAYTGAEKDEKGFIEEAGGGTLFLDEIGDLSPASQVKLLRLIENKEYFPLNSKTPQRADVRIIAATNTDLEGKVKNGMFREDLSHRLGLRLHIPPLRQRSGDLEILLDFFITRSSEKKGKQIPRYTPELIGLLESYEFPGNVRELESMIEEAVSKNQSAVLPLTVFKERIEKTKRSGETVITEQGDSRMRFTFRGSLTGMLDEIETTYIKDALVRAKGNRIRAAELLGVNYDWLKRRVRKQDQEAPGKE